MGRLPPVVMAVGAATVLPRRMSCKEKSGKCRQAQSTTADEVKNETLPVRGRHGEPAAIEAGARSIKKQMLCRVEAQAGRTQRAAAKAAAPNRHRGA
jgi:hypothetical protein